jgi:Lactonase, 7-bladed beta-propeller/Phosphoesterase family
MFGSVGLLSLLAATGCTPNRQRAAREGAAARSASAVTWPGRKADGSVLLPNGWSLRPAGRQLELGGDFPVNIALHPGGRYAAVLHAGYSRHEVVIVDLAAERVVSRTPLHETFYGLEFSTRGDRLYCSGAGDEVVHVFDFRDGRLNHPRTIRLRPKEQTGVPAGLALDRAEHQLYAADVWGQRVSCVTLGPAPKSRDILLGTNAAAIAAAPVKPSADFDTAAAEKRAEAALYDADSSEPFPYACRLDEKRQRLYVSLWAQAAVAVVDLNSRHVVARWPTQEHPCEMALTRSGQRLFVANASRNTVSVFDTDTGKLNETICAALYPNAPPGSTPNSLALTPDERSLFVANADNNMVAVFDVSRPGTSRSLGFIPVGWYPTSVRVSLDGKRLFVANGKAGGSMANPLGPQPGVNNSESATLQYIAQLFRSTLGIVDLPSGKDSAAQYAVLTRQAYRCCPLRADGGVREPRPKGNPIPARPGEASPIKYCLYIIKENRTYDQVLGDMPEGNGDPKLCLFPERVTPNEHRLAREFVLLDNFYVDSEVSADGHEWSMGAYATDFVEKTWPLDYGHNRSGKFPYPSEGNFPIATPAGGYLWDRAGGGGISYRSYGEFIENGRLPGMRSHSRVKALQGHFDPWYQGFDLSYPDTERAARFISELHRFESQGDMPRLQILRLPNDHTHGSTVGLRTPTAYVADNDLALGRIIEALTRSKFWPQLAVFVVEDDAQNGPDHVDAHRTTAYLISPYARHRAVDSTLYSTSSMLRTMELILGLKPMSQFDAAARPMFNAFQNTADLRAYQALPANVDLNARNGRHAWGGNLKLDFAREDAVDDLLLNELVWRSVRGPTSPAPAPVRAGFVFPHDQEERD